MDRRQLAQAAQDENVPFHADACQVRYDPLLPCHVSGEPSLTPAKTTALQAFSGGVERADSRTVSVLWT